MTALTEGLSKFEYPKIQAAEQWKKRPTAMLMEDEYFGKRHYDTGLPLKNANINLWTSWDFAIVTAYQTIEYYTDENGVFYWYKEDPEERIDAKRKIDPFKAGVDRITSAKKYKAAHGEYFVPEIKSSRENQEMWTFQEWRDAMRQKMLDEMSAQPEDRFEGGSE